MDKKVLMEELEQLGKLRGADAFATGLAGGQGAIRLEAGTVVGDRYRLVRELGRGGMGEVWLAEDIRLGRVFALKFLVTELVGSSDALSRMHREYEVLERLTHPNIVRVFDMDQDKGSGRWYLRMEYVDGEDVGEKIALALKQAHRPLFGMEQIVGWLGQIVEALDYAHQQGILHRDLKPANLMLTTQPERLKVMDFGIARVVSETHLTQHTAMMGSMYYAAPELLRGQAATAATDIYSFGILVYELLTGDLPVGRFALPSTVVAGVSKGVDDVIERMLAGNPKQRGESLREVWPPLRDALLGKATQVSISSPKIEVIAPSQAKSAESTAGARRVFQVGGVDFPMRWIPAGTFWMGAGSDDKEASGDEKPQHEVTITRGFWMGETPVTQSQYQAIMGHNPSRFKEAGPSAPVERMSWFDAARFANELSSMEGVSLCFVGGGKKLDGVGNKGSDYLGCKGWRLPTEAEWEYACRAGTTAPRYGNLGKIAWYGKNSNNTTHPIGEKAANPWGLYDTLGNVWEWCYDWHGDYSEQVSTDPVGATKGTSRITRGGSYFNKTQFVRAAQPRERDPSVRDIQHGFRLVRSGV